MDAVEEIKQRLSIEDVIGQYVELKRAGRNFKGLSPFGNEKTASFMVSPEKQIWHDFSSGKGGNMFSFVMEMEGVDFKGALELLARKAGVELTQYQRRPGEGKVKQRLSEANELAAKFYQVHLSKNQDAIDYVFKKRKIDKNTALSFRLGYAPNNGAALTDFATKKGFSTDELKRAGLSTQRGRVGDMFRSRIMIPLMDPQGQAIGFTGRLLEDIPNAPKYLNTPQTPLYDKSRHVFGLHLAKESIRKSGYAVIVEGNMDVVASHQVGVNNVVATAGTAITEHHLKALSRFVQDVRLAFDQDVAGIAAAERAIPLASKAGVNLSIVTVTNAKDPDELIQKNPKAWQEVIDKPEYALDWLMRVYQERLDLAKAPDKRLYSDVMLTVVKSLQDPVEQEHFLEKLGKTLGVSKEALQSKLQTNKQATRLKQPAFKPAPPVHSAEVIKSQNHLLALALTVPNLRNHLDLLTVDMLPEAQGQQLFKFLKQHPEFSGGSKADPQLLEMLSDLQDYVKVLGVIFEELYQNLETSELREEATRLQVRLIEQYVKSQKQPLTAALQTVDDKQADAILKQVKALDALLKQSQSK
ncbi:MAG: primase [Patescibacteria group bacterium]|nr:primase [Patescibacteria group bacterium]